MDKAFPYTIASWLLLGDILPNTPLAQISATYTLPVLWFSQDSFLSLSIVSAFLLCAWLSFIGFASRQKTAFALWLLVLAHSVVYILTAYVSIFQHTNSLMPGNVVMSIFMGLTIARVAGTAEKLSQLLSILGAIQAGYTVFFFCTRQDHLFSGTVMRAGGTFHDPTILYPILLSTLCLSFSCIFYSNMPLRRALYVGCTLLIYIALCCTGYRTALIAAAVAIIWQSYRSVAPRRFNVLLAILLIVCSIFAFHIRTVGTVNSASANRSVKSRMIVWVEAWDIFKAHPYVGVGPTKLLLPIAIEQHGRYSIAYAVQPFNVLLYWLCEMGIVGGILLSMYVMVISRIIHENNAAASLGYGGVWLALLLAGVTDTPFGPGDEGHSLVNTIVVAMIGGTLMVPQHKLGSAS